MYSLLRPERLYTPAEILSLPCPVPKEPGAYAWYMAQVPPGVPVVDCHRYLGLPLLYVGIAPRRPPSGDAPPSKRTLRDRLRQHLRGNASASTLRLSLGSLLAGDLGLVLQRSGTSCRLTFGPGEQRLSSWMAEYTRITWVVADAPWVLEERLMRECSLPLNLQGNEAHPFAETLHAARSAARERARA